MRFDVAMPDDLHSMFEDASGQDLDAFWHLWFEIARGRVEIVMDSMPASPTPATPVVGSQAPPVRSTPVD
jgi:hypothetical protein